MKVPPGFQTLEALCIDRSYVLANGVDDVALKRRLTGACSSANSARSGNATEFCPGGNWMSMPTMTAQQRAHSATAMNANGGHVDIPDRRVWKELSAHGASIWQRLKGGAAAANDMADKARIKVQGRFLPVLRAQKANIRQTGQTLPGDHNAYLAEETFSGKVGRRLFEIDEDFTRRIIAIMAAKRAEDD